MKRVLLILIAIIGFSSLFAFDNMNTAMGFHYGTSTGIGYSVRHWTNKNGMQGTIAAYTYGNDNPKYKQSDFWEEDSDDPSGLISKNKTKISRRKTGIIGLNYLWNLQRTNKYHFYVISGGSFTLQKVKRYYDVDDYKWENDNRWTIGAGPGIEYKLSERFHVSAELPFTYNHKDNIRMYIPAVGVYYYFR